MATLLGKIYPVEKEGIFIGAVKGRPKKQPKKVPHIKVRVSRGKNYNHKAVIKDEKDAEMYFRDYLNNYNIEGQEQFLVMYLTRSNSVIGIYPHSKGGMTASIVDVKMIAATALSLLAEAVITCHNHPSGQLSPSDADRTLAKRLDDALSAQGIKLLDNLIITKKGSNRF